MDIKMLTTFVSLLIIPNAINIYGLDLSNQGLTEFPSPIDEEEDRFILSNNQISEIPGDAFLTVRRISYFSINSNELTEFYDFGNKKSTIRFLGFARNKIKYIPKESLIGLTSLERLFLNDNVIIQMPDVSSLLILADLFLSNNAFVEIEPNRLPQNGTKLKALFIHNLPLTLDFSVLKPVEDTATNLGLDGICPPIISREDLKGFQSLSSAVLRDSAIQKMPDFYYQAQTLSKIQLQNNNIVRIQLKDVRPLLQPLDSGPRQQLTLSNNTIQSFPCIKELKNSFAKIDLTLNPLHCDCRTKSLISEVQNSNNTFLTVDEFPCKTPMSRMYQRWYEIDTTALHCSGDSETAIQYEGQTEGLKRSGSYLRVLKTRNILQCMRACHHDDQCWAFNYKASTGLCELIEHTKCGEIEEEGTITYELISIYSKNVENEL